MPVSAAWARPDRGAWMGLTEEFRRNALRLNLLQQAQVQRKTSGKCRKQQKQSSFLKKASAPAISMCESLFVSMEG
jgi:hypothetical protein